MEWANMPCEMDEYPAEETKERSGVDWILHRGLAIGKKILVAGIVISSAPIVLPPLVVMSALGFAVSVPYGMILASYTCSEKLLNRLLRETSSPFSLEVDNYASANEEVEEDDEFSGALSVEEKQEKKSDEVKEDLNTRTGTSTPGEEPGEEVIVGYGEKNRHSPTSEQPAATRIEGIILTAESSEHDHSNPVILEASVEIIDVISAEDLVPANDKKSDHGAIGKIEAANEAKNKGEKSKKKGRTKEKVDKKKFPKASDETAEIRSGVVQPLTAGTDAKEDQPNHAKDGVKIKTSEKVTVHSMPGVTTPNVETNSAQQVIFPSLSEGMYTEEGIWQKIDAMRLIVGYKVARQASCIEELRALYLFMGVEPPASFKDASDLAELNEKLHFLFSVVGVE